MKESSYANIHIKSKKLADYLKEYMDEIDCGSAIKIKKSDISIEVGDYDLPFEYVEPPSTLNCVIERFFDAISFIDYEPDDVEELTQSIKEVKWHAEQWGIGDLDGSYERENYAPDVLQELLEDIAEAYDCTPDDVTDEMFSEYVEIDPGTITEYATFEYSDKTGKSEYYYDNRMKVEQIETDEKKPNVQTKE